MKTKVKYIYEPQCGKWVVYSLVEYVNPSAFQKGPIKNYVGTVDTEAEAVKLIERLT